MPLAGPQTRAYESEADELYYGGAAGGGKSDLLIGLALTRHTRSRIFRREATQLEAIINRSREVVGVGGSLRQTSPAMWRLNDGRSIELAGVKEEADKRKFQGRPADFIGFDELPEFTESQYRFLIGWNRTTIVGQRCRVVAAGNPPTTPEGEWVIRRWAPWLDQQHPRPADAGELRWFAVVKNGEEVEVEDGEPFERDGEMVYPRSRTFIPASLEDNPFLLATGYAATLQSMPEPLRSQMLYGSFTAGHLDHPWQVIPTAWVIAAQQRWRPDARPEGPMDAVGVDVARGGKDKTVLARRWANWFAPLERHAGRDTPDGEEGMRLVLAALAAGGCANIDVIGPGASVLDLSRIQGANVVPIVFSEAAPGMDRTGLLRFTNLRAYAYWALRDALDPEKGDGIMLPPDPELKADLCAPRWTPRLNGIQIELKEEIAKRLGRSPDAGDAVVMAALEQPKMGIWSL